MNKVKHSTRSPLMVTSGNARNNMFSVQYDHLDKTHNQRLRFLVYSWYMLKGYLVMKTMYRLKIQKDND
jgi:hypothetical protein